MQRREMSLVFSGSWEDKGRRFGTERGFQEVYRAGKAGEGQHPGSEKASGQEIQGEG